VPAPPGVPVDMDGDGLSDDEERAIGTLTTHPDTDGDGLLDGWEVNGLESHGRLEPLPAYGASPLRKDVFVEIDWMTTDEASAQVSAVIAYQAAADIQRAFRRSGTGIEIHFDLGAGIEDLIPEHLIEPDVDLDQFHDEPDTEKVIPYQSVFPARPTCGPGSGELSLYDVYMGGRFFRPSRRNLFYYAVIVEAGRPVSEQRTEPVTSRSFADDFEDDLARRDQLIASGVHVVCISRKPAPDISPELARYHYSVSLFHELGHAFGLGHGGAILGVGWDNNNYKPNYPSIMNYRYQHCGVDIQDGIPVMDLSRGKLRVPLYETALDESAGMGDLPSKHLLECLGLRSLENQAFPSNVDWNDDGFLGEGPISRDLNDNGELDARAHTDHDDWGKLARSGFAGIGRRAYAGCGMVCRRRGEVSSVLGDFDGDGDQDVFLLRGDEAAWAMSAGGTLAIDPGAVRSGWVGNWEITPGQEFMSGDFLGVGREMVFCHRSTEVAVLDWNSGSPKLAWFEDVRIPVPQGASTEGWKIGISDRFLPVRFSGSPHVEMTVTNGIEVSVLSASGEEDAKIITAWTSGGRMIEWTGGEMANVRPGREMMGGGQTFLIASSSALIEVLGPTSDPGVRPIGRDGYVIPADNGLPPWPIAPDDCIQRADMDGDGALELLIQRPSRLGVVRWIEGAPRLVWAASGSIDGTFDLTGKEKVLLGDLVAGGGMEVLVASGDAWATLGWDAGRGTVALLTVNRGAVPGPWALGAGQSVLVGAFLGDGSGDAALVHDGLRVAVLRFVPESGFQVVKILEGTIGEWPLMPDDILVPARLDADPELEVIVWNGSRIGVLDLAGSASSFIAEIGEDTLEFAVVPTFLRGDANGDAEIDISDAVALLGNLFLSFRQLPCDDSADTDESGELDISDAISLLGFLFNHGRPPQRPGPYKRGIDPTVDELGCKDPAPR